MQPFRRPGDRHHGQSQTRAGQPLLQQNQQQSAVWKGHAPQISISDENHHVTDAIGSMYGDDDGGPRPPPNSYGNPLTSNPVRLATELQQPQQQQQRLRSSVESRQQPTGRVSVNAYDGTQSRRVPASPRLNRQNTPPTVNMTPSYDQSSNSQSLRSRSPVLASPPTEVVHSKFPLNGIDYESDPAAIAQELSNLQALRRMSMDAQATADPDLPMLSPSFVPPTPTGNDSEDGNDLSVLTWVPARVHPELAPMEYKSFMDEKLAQIRRRSGDSSGLAPNSSSDLLSGGTSLRRKKSMLSRQIDRREGESYQDGADRLERKKSTSARNPHLAMIQESAIKDESDFPIARLSLEELEKRPDSPQSFTDDDDRPILPTNLGLGLKRSTRTTYRRGSTREGRRVLPSGRAGRVVSPNLEEGIPALPTKPVSEFTSVDLHDQVADPTNIEKPLNVLQAGNFSRPIAAVRQPTSSPSLSERDSNEDIRDQGNHSEEVSQQSHLTSVQPQNNGVRGRDHQGQAPGKVTPSAQQQVKEKVQQVNDHHAGGNEANAQAPSFFGLRGHHTPGRFHGDQVIPLRQVHSAPRLNQQTLSDIVQQPTPLPGNSNRTDSLSIVPFGDYEDSKADKRARDKYGAPEAGTRKSSWGGWFGKDSKEDKESSKEKDGPKKLKAKMPKASDKNHDNIKLDAPQSSHDAERGRKSEVLDRDKMEEDRRREALNRKMGVTEPAPNTNNKKDSGLFSSIFGGGKRRGDREPAHKKNVQTRAHSLDSYRGPLIPDKDYCWTRFTVMEERAIYRMAHIKLASPKRSLKSQVLLSNFMYGYLALVQQRNPEMNVAQGPLQRKKKEQEEKQKKEEHEQVYMNYQQQQQEQEQRQQSAQQPQQSLPDQSSPQQHPLQSHPNSPQQITYSQRGSSVSETPEY